MPHSHDHEQRKSSCCQDLEPGREEKEEKKKEVKRVKEREREKVDGKGGRKNILRVTFSGLKLHFST